MLHPIFHTYNYTCKELFNHFNIRKAKLLAELEVSSSTNEDLGADVDYEAAVDERMQKMVTTRHHLFTNASKNIKDAQARYKKNYDRKRSQTEVTYFCLLHTHALLFCSTY